VVENLGKKEGKENLDGERGTGNLIRRGRIGQGKREDRVNPLSLFVRNRAALGGRPQKGNKKKISKDLLGGGRKKKKRVQRWIILDVSHFH